MAPTLPRDFSARHWLVLWRSRAGPGAIPGTFFGRIMATTYQFRVGDRVGLRGSDGSPDHKMIGIIEKIEPQWIELRRSPRGSVRHFYVVRRSNGPYFAAAETALVRAPAERSIAAPHHPAYAVDSSTSEGVRKCGGLAYGTSMPRRRSIPQ
jgi:hypothetical protein